MHFPSPLRWSLRLAQYISCCSRCISRIQLCALGACERLSGFLRLVLVHLARGRSAAGIVVPVEMLALAAVSEPHLETPNVGNAFGRVWDDADAIDHPEMILRSRPTGNRLEIVDARDVTPAGEDAGLFPDGTSLQVWRENTSFWHQATRSMNAYVVAHPI